MCRFTTDHSWPVRLLSGDLVLLNANNEIFWMPTGPSNCVQAGELMERAAQALKRDFHQEVSTRRLLLFAPLKMRTRERDRSHSNSSVLARGM